MKAHPDLDSTYPVPSSTLFYYFPNAPAKQDLWSPLNACILLHSKLLDMPFSLAITPFLNTQIKHKFL